MSNQPMSNQPGTPRAGNGNGNGNAAKPKWSNFERYLCGEYITPHQKFTLTVARVDILPVYMKRAQANVPTPVLFFKEATQGFPVTITANRRKLNKLFGNDMHSCVGKRIVFEVRPKEVAGEMMFPIYVIGKVEDANVANGTQGGKPGAESAAPAQATANAADAEAHPIIAKLASALTESAGAKSGDDDNAGDDDADDSDDEPAEDA